MPLLLSRRQWCSAAAAFPFLVPGCSRKGDQIRIVVIPKGMTHEFWQSIWRGSLRAAQDLSEEHGQVTIIWDGPLRERDILEQIQIVDRRIAYGVQGIILAPQHSRIMCAPVQRAWAAGIPVVVIDSGIACTSSIIKYVATDNYHGGWLAAAYLAEQLVQAGIEQPKLILIRYQVGSESTEQRERGFLEYFSAGESTWPRTRPVPAVTWLSQNQYAGATRDSASRSAAPILQQYRDQVDAVFAPNESSASGVLDVLRSLGVNAGNPANKRRIMLMGFDSSKPLLQAIADGDVAGSIIQDPYKMGYVATTTLVRYLRGWDVNDHRQTLNRSTGEYLVTRSNVLDRDTRKRFNPTIQAERDMLAECAAEDSR